MTKSDILNTKTTRVSEILEQLDQLNMMIKIHEDNPHSSMLEQYKYMKNEFINELNSILKEFQISIKAA